jgi:hypothetical protein
MLIVGEGIAPIVRSGIRRKQLANQIAGRRKQTGCPSRNGRDGEEGRSETGGPFFMAIVLIYCRSTFPPSSAQTLDIGYWILAISEGENINPTIIHSGQDDGL